MTRSYLLLDTGTGSLRYSNAIGRSRGSMPILRTIGIGRQKGCEWGAGRCVVLVFRPAEIRV